MRKRFRMGDIVHVNSDPPGEFHVVEHYYKRTFNFEDRFVNIWFLPAGRGCDSMVAEQNMTLVARGKKAKMMGVLYGKA